jgi:integrase
MRSSRRLVVLPRLAVAALLRHRTVQARERLRAGPRWGELGLVFPNTVGRAILPQNLLQRSLYPLLERAGLPRLRFHDLRHSAATLLLARGGAPEGGERAAGAHPGRDHAGLVLACVRYDAPACGGYLRRAAWRSTWRSGGLGGG